MALSFRGSAEGSASDGEDVTATMPGGTAEGDVVYAALGIASVTNIDMSMDTSGYTELADVAASGSNLGVFRKIMGASPDASAVGNGDGAAGHGVGIVIHVWTGANQATPEDATTTTGTDTASAVDGPSITTVTANAIVLSCFCADDDDTTVTVPSGYGNGVDVAVNTTQDITVGMASILQAAAGAQNPGAWGISAADWSAATVAIRPAVVGGAHRFFVMF